MPEIDSVFHQIALVLALCALVGLVAARLRQPLIVGFIAAGILAGPEGLGLVAETAEIELLASIGISLLLFVVGLKLDVGLIRTVGPVALATGLGQVAFTSAVGFGIALALGLSTVPALYVAVALTFSSTIIIVKLLSDKRETEDLHGRIAIGFLIVQDIVVVLVMIALTAFGDPVTADGLGREFLLVALRGAALIGGLVALTRWVIPPLLHRVAHHPELLVLFAITWAVALAAISDVLGFSEEVGAFLAGVSLASTPYREAIGGRLTSLRDFLVLFFFIELGVGLDLGQAGELLVPALVLSVFVLIGNPLIVLVIMGAMGYRKRVSFLAGLTVAQISEFSLILAALGAGLGHIGGDIVGLITTVGLITIGLSTYLIYNSGWLFERLAGPLSLFERRSAKEVKLPESSVSDPEVIVFGLGRLGDSIMSGLRSSGVPVMGVDIDPTVLGRWEEHGVPVMYGDAEDPEVPDALPLAATRWVVVTARRRDAALGLLHALRHHGYEGGIALAADTEADAELFERAGAEYVLRPFDRAADHAVGVLTGRGDGPVG